MEMKIVINKSKLKTVVDSICCTADKTKKPGDIPLEMNAF